VTTVKGNTQLISGLLGFFFGLATPLTVIFTFLKLINIIHWSWLWVLSPLFISTGAGILLVIGLLLLVVIAVILGSERATQKR
jgi:hypothetical protein